MTPLEKASQMIVDYQLTFKSLSYEEAVQCSIRTVDDILLELELVCVDEMVQFSNRWKYWEEVKELLEKQSNKYHIVDTNEMISSQTEISDEEILHAASRCRFNADVDISIGSFELGARWYREQLKSRQ